jgi:hypothetical protein
VTEPIAPKQVNPTADPPAAPDASPTNVPGDGQQPVGAAAPPEKTFTQAEMDRVIAERLARERAKYPDYDDLKSSAEKWAEHELAQRSELEQAQAAAQAAQAALDLEKQRVTDLQIQSAFVGWPGHRSHGCSYDPRRSWQTGDERQASCTCPRRGSWSRRPTG